MAHPVHRNARAIAGLPQTPHDLMNRRWSTGLVPDRRDLRGLRLLPPRPGVGIIAGMGTAEMRAADADRQAVAERLRAALDEGRIDLHEYDERLQRAYEAKTYEDLDRLLADLPGAEPSTLREVPAVPAATGGVVSPGAAAVRYPGATWRWVVDIWGAYLGVMVLPVVIWLVASIAEKDLMFFWPMWVSGPLGVVVLTATAIAVARGEPQKWAAEEDATRTAKQLKRERRRERKRQARSDAVAGGAERAIEREPEPRQ